MINDPLLQVGSDPVKTGTGRPQNHRILGLGNRPVLRKLGHKVLCRTVGIQRNYIRKRGNKKRICRLCMNSSKLRIKTSSLCLYDALYSNALPSSNYHV